MNYYPSKSTKGEHTKYFVQKKSEWFPEKYMFHIKGHTEKKKHKSRGGWGLIFQAITEFLETFLSQLV